jgi:hypothetical protein
MLVLQLVKETFSESFRGHNLWNVIGIIGLTISDQLQNVSSLPQVVILENSEEFWMKFALWQVCQVGDLAVAVVVEQVQSPALSKHRN